MSKELAIIAACLITVAGLCAVSFHAGADFQKSADAKAVAQEADRQARADAQAVEGARDISTEIDKGLTQDARKTETAVTGAKARITALKPPVLAPVPQCGPSAYVIKVEGASPDDVWRAYADGRNSLLKAAADSSASGVHSVNSDAVVSTSTTQPE